MSLRDGARACIIQAIHDRKNLDLTAAQLNDLVPSGPEIGTQDAFAWLQILIAASKCMRTKGHPTGQPKLESAKALLDKPVIESQLYLEGLAANASMKTGPKLAPFLIAGGLAAVMGAVAFASRKLFSKSAK